jgi:hypothetical protein
MTGPAYLAGKCAVRGCPRDRATNLGVCVEHWRELPAELRRAWWTAWHDDCRVAVYLAARRACVEHLERA